VVSGAAGVSIGAGSAAATLRGRRTFGAAAAASSAGVGMTAAARFGDLRVAVTALRAAAFGLAVLRAVVAARPRAVAAFAGFAATLRVAAFAAVFFVAVLRVAVFAVAAAARFGAALRAAGAAAARRRAAGFAAAARLAGVFFTPDFAPDFALVFAAALAPVFDAFAVFVGFVVFADLVFAARGAAFAVDLRAPVARVPRVPVPPAARRVVGRAASACARGWSPLLSSLLTSGFSLSAEVGWRSLIERPRARPHPQDARRAQRRSRCARRAAGGGEDGGCGRRHACGVADATACHRSNIAVAMRGERTLDESRLAWKQP